jgi:RNA polymerase sigma factor (sigma-70 family)
VNEALMHLRETKKLFLHVDMGVASEISSEFPTSSYQEEELLKLIYKLPVGYRTVFNLYAIEGYSHQEIGELLNISISTSKSQLNRARNLLQQYIHALDKEDNSTYEI